MTLTPTETYLAKQRPEVDAALDRAGDSYDSALSPWRDHQTLAAEVVRLRDEATTTKSEDSDSAEFDTRACLVLMVGREMLIKFFGYRCPVYEPDCLCCKRWEYLDKLTESPFED